MAVLSEAAMETLRRFYCCDDSQVEVVRDSVYVTIPIVGIDVRLYVGKAEVLEEVATARASA